MARSCSLVTIGQSAIFLFLLFYSQGTAGILTAADPLQPQPNISQTAEKLEQLVEGEKILNDFRRQRLGGDYSFKFELKHMPRRGAITRYRGQLWGTWGDTGARTRVLIPGADDAKDFSMLVHNGPEPKVWSVVGESNPPSVRELDGAELFEPLLPGLIITPFDLQMPFIYWPKYVFEGTSKKLGRTLFAFLMYPPEATATTNPELGAVRIFLEEKSRQWLKAELVDKEGQPLKSFKIISVKKIGDEGFPKAIDFLDEKTRSKTRFRITAAVLGQNFAKDLFQPEYLTEEVPVVADKAFTYLK